MREVKKKKVKKSILLRVAILCLVVYVAAALIYWVISLLIAGLTSQLEKVAKKDRQGGGRKRLLKGSEQKEGVA